MRAEAMAGGRPKGSGSLKTPLRVARIIKETKEGKTREQICEIVGIKPRTLRLWKQEDWEFAASLKQAEDFAADIVESSLFKKATGFEYTIENQEHVTKDGDVIQFDQTVYVPPSDTAAIFWLKNKRPEVWKDKREEELKFIMLKEQATATMTSDELIEEMKRLLTKLEDARAKQLKPSND